MRHLSNVLELLGLLMVFLAGYLWHWQVGLAVAGVYAVVFGFLLDRPAPGADE